MGVYFAKEVQNSNEATSVPRVFILKECLQSTNQERPDPKELDTIGSWLGTRNL
jgi:hypothetical protein